MTALDLLFYAMYFTSTALAVSFGVDSQGSWNAESWWHQAESSVKKKLEHVLAEVGGTKKKSSQSVVVHYEALCPDSVEFFKGPKGVNDVFHSSAVDATFMFVPYGNARSGGNNWGYRVCQHGDRECYGNAWQTCAQAMMTNKTKVASHLICLMDLPKPGMPKNYWFPQEWGCGTYESCVVSKCSSSLTQVEKINIKKCVQDVKHNQMSCTGCKLMQQHAKDAHSNKVNHVPWVIVDGAHEEELDEGTMKLQDYLTMGSKSNVYSQDTSRRAHVSNLSAVDPADWVVPPSRNPLMQRE